MWNHQDKTRTSGIERRAGLEEEVRLNIKVSNEGDTSESLEDLSEDEIFKELINIVVDVFSHKSENCLLTFEIPSQSDGLASDSVDSLSSNVGDQSDLPVPFKSFESIPSRKSSKHERNLKLPIAKPSKHNNKKIVGKKVNPIVQTVLHAKRGFTDLETLYKLRHRSPKRGKWQLTVGSNGHIIREESEKQNKIEKEFKRKREVAHILSNQDHDTIKSEEEQCEKYSLLQQCSVTDVEDSSRESNVYNPFHEVFDKLKMLMSIYDKNSHSHLEWVHYHITEIKSHISAISSYLVSRSSDQSSSAFNNVMNHTMAETAGSTMPRTRKNRQDGTLYRISTKKSFVSRSRRRRLNRNNYNRSVKYDKDQQVVYSKKKDRAGMSLEDVLENYQRVKMEETELVKVLLRRLGLAKVESERSYSQNHHQDERTPVCYCQSRETSYERECEAIQTTPTPENNRLKNSNGVQRRKAPVEQGIYAEDLSRAVDERSETLKRSIRGQRRLMTRSFEGNGKLTEGRLTDKMRPTKCAMPTSPVQGKPEEPLVPNEEDKKAPLKGSFTTEDTTNPCCDKVLVQYQEKRGTMPFKEEDMMSRIQNAAERLEHMQELVEKKLGYLCKQKEFYQEMKSSLLTSKADQEECTVKEESAFKKDNSNCKQQHSMSQNDVYSSPETAHTPTVKSFPTYVQYTNINLEESKDFREILKGFKEASNEVANPRFKPRKTMSSQLSEDENDTPGDRMLVGKTYICNYMMEMRGSEITDDQEANYTPRQIHLVSGVESNINVSDSEKNQIHDRPILEKLYVIKEVNREGVENNLAVNDCEKNEVCDRQESILERLYVSNEVNRDVSGVENNVDVNDCEKNQVHVRHDSTVERPDIIKEVSQEGVNIINENVCKEKTQIPEEDSVHGRHDVIIEEVNLEDDATSKEPLVNMNEPSMGCEEDETEPRVKKKISRSNYPKKSWCTLS